MNESNTWKWVGIISMMLLVSVLCCLLGLCWGSMMGFLVGQRLSEPAYSWPQDEYEMPYGEEPYFPEESWRPWLGVYFQMTSEGALITNVVLDSPAERAGLQVDDVIVEFDGQQVTEQQPLDVIVGEYYPGDAVTLIALRDGSEREFDVTLGVFPGSELLPGPEYFEVPPFDEG